MDTSRQLKLCWKDEWKERDPKRRSLSQKGGMKGESRSRRGQRGQDRVSSASLGNMNEKHIEENTQENLKYMNGRSQNTYKLHEY